MRRYCAVILFSFFCLACSSSLDSDGIPLRFSAKPSGVEYAPPAPKEFLTANGIKVLFLEDEELPLLDLSFYNRKGSLHLQSVPSAVMAATGSQMRAGGAGQWSADELDLELERLSASADSDIGSESASVGVSGLVSDRKILFEILAAVVQKPRFEEERLSIWQGKALDSIARRKEDPYTVASTSFNQVLYPDSVYGEVTVSADVKKITRLDLLRAHRSLFTPKNAIITITGAISEEEVKRLVQTYFGDWNASSGSYNPIPSVTDAPKPGLYLIEMPFEQATFIIGQQGVKRLGPQHYAITVFNDIFGGLGFGSRLVEKVRVELGLAYSAYGAVSPGVAKGKNIITAQTKSESVVAAMQASLEVLSALQAQGATAEELIETKNGIENSLVFRFTSPEDLVARVAALDLLDYPLDYDRKYLDNINAVSLKDVQSVANELWQFDKFVGVVVGNKLAVDAVELAVTAGDLTLPGVPVFRRSFNEMLIDNKAS